MPRWWVDEAVVDETLETQPSNKAWLMGFKGDGAIINTNAGVDHDCRIGSGAHIGPGSALAGNVEIGCESFLGAGTCVVPCVRIGSRAIVGAGSVVLRDIPDNVIAMGVPARITGRIKTPPN